MEQCYGNATSCNQSQNNIRELNIGVDMKKFTSEIDQRCCQNMYSDTWTCYGTYWWSAAPSSPKCIHTFPAVYALECIAYTAAPPMLVVNILNKNCVTILISGVGPPAKICCRAPLSPLPKKGHEFFVGAKIGFGWIITVCVDDFLETSPTVRDYKGFIMHSLNLFCEMRETTFFV